MATNIVRLKPGSDGDASHVPPDGGAFTKVDPPTLYLEKIGLQWMTARGEAQPGIKYALESLPAGYTMWQRQRPGDSAIYDKYLFGHPQGRKFDSPNRFYPHFEHLMENGGESFGCPCTVCIGSTGILPGIQKETPLSSRRSSAISLQASMPVNPQHILKQPPGAITHTSQGRGRPKKVSVGLDTSRVDEEGTPDVYRNLIDKLERNTYVDQSIEEPLSPDWQAEQSLLPKMLSTLKQQPQWTPRSGDIVLYIRELPDGVKLARNKTTGDIQVYNERNGECLGHPAWEAGLVGQDPAVKPKPADLLQRNNETNIMYSGVRIQPIADPNTVDKTLAKRYRYISLHQCRPFLLWQQLLHRTPRERWHVTIANALTSMSTLSLIGKYRFRGTWPEAYVYCHGLYIGAEMLVVGDTARLLPNPKHGQTTCVDVLVIKSIRLKWINLDKASSNDYDEGRPYNSEIWVYGAAWTQEASRSDKQWLSHEIAGGPKAAEGYGDWFPLHPPNKELAVPYSRLAGRLYEQTAMSTWLDNEAIVGIDQGRAGVIEARQYSMMHNQRIARVPAATWHWGDSRAEALNLQTINGQEVSNYDQDRNVREWRKNVQVAESVNHGGTGDGNSRQAAGAPATMVSRDLRRFMAPGTAGTASTTNRGRPQHSSSRMSRDVSSSADEESRPSSKRYQEIELSDDEAREIRQTTKFVQSISGAEKKKAKVMVVID